MRGEASSWPYRDHCGCPDLRRNFLPRPGPSSAGIFSYSLRAPSRRFNALVPAGQGTAAQRPASARCLHLLTSLPNLVNPAPQAPELSHYYRHGDSTPLRVPRNGKSRPSFIRFDMTENSSVSCIVDSLDTTVRRSIGRQVSGCQRVCFWCILSEAEDLIFRAHSRGLGLMAHVYMGHSIWATKLLPEFYKRHMEFG